MEFYRAEYLIENLKNFLEKENEQRKKEEADYQKNTLNTSSPSKLMSDAQKSLPKINIPSFNLSNFKF
jgi:esterase/lipase